MKRNIYKFLSGAKRDLFALALIVSGAVQAQQSFTFQYTGSVQTLTLGVGNWQFECWGANGGSITSVGGGGIGGYSKGAYNITTQGTQINIYVGGVGAA